MIAYRIINLIVWGGLLLYVAPSAWCAAFGKHVRRGDPMRLAVLTTAFVICGFNLRWLIAPQSEVMWQALYALSAADALYIGRLVHAYGRGPRV